MNRELVKNRRTTGGIALIALIPLILIAIYMIYNGWDYVLGEEISPDETTKFFFRKFIKKVAILFSI